MEMSDFEVSFKRDPIFGFWSWTAEAGEVNLAGPLLGVCAGREGAERDANRRIRLYCDRYSVNGAELAARLA